MTIQQNFKRLILSASDLTRMVKWDQKLIEDYLSIFDDTLYVAKAVDGISVDISSLTTRVVVLEGKVFVLENKKLEQWSSLFTAGSVLFISGGFAAQDNTNLFWDNTNKRLGIGTNSTNCCTLDVVGKSHFQTGGILASDGIIIQPTPSNVPALGAPIPEIRGELFGGLSTVFGLRGGMFLFQNSTDIVAPVPILYFTDDVGDITTAASIDYTPSTYEMKFQNADVYNFVPRTNGYVKIGLATVPTGMLHVQRDNSDDFPLIKLQNELSGDVTISLQTSSDFLSMGLDGSVSGKPFCIDISEKLNTANNAFTIDRANNRTGIKTTTPNSTHDINGSVSRAIESVSVDTNLGETHEVLLVNASGAARNIYLPARSGLEGRRYTIKKIDSTANTVTINRAGSDTIDGATTLVLTTQYQARTVINGPAEWNIIGAYL